MTMYETKERIEKFLGETLDHFIPDQYAKTIHKILDKVDEYFHNQVEALPEEEQKDVNEPTDATESESTDIQPSEERQSESDTKPAEGTDSSTDDSTTSSK